MIDKYYYTYILTNLTRTVLYTGITGNLIARIYQHKQKLASDFTTKYNVNKLVYYEMHTDPQIAILREKQIKNLLRSKKIALINSFNPLWEDLYAKIKQ